jgi:hypothetical protein
MRRRIRRRHFKKISLLEAIKKDLSYSEYFKLSKERIRKSDYFKLKKLYKTKDTTLYYTISTKKAQNIAQKLLKSVSINKIPNRLLISVIPYTNLSEPLKSNEIANIIITTRNMLLEGYDNLTIFRKIKNRVLKYKNLFKNYQLFEMEFYVFDNFGNYTSFWRVRKYLKYESEYINNFIWAGEKLLEFESFNSINIKDVRVWLVK